MILILNDALCKTAGSTLTHNLKLKFGDTVKSVEVEDFLSTLDSDSPAIIILPEIKGEHNQYPKYLGRKGKNLIQQHVKAGAMYAGFCAGAYNACSKNTYNSPSGIKKLKNAEDLLALSPIHASGTLPGFGKKMDSEFHIEGGHSCELVDIFVQGHGKKHAWYENGPFFHVDKEDVPKHVQVLARYILEDKFPVAAFIEKVGHGKILLCGVLPHLDLLNRTFQPNHALWDLIVNAMEHHLIDFTPRPMLQTTP